MVGLIDEGARLSNGALFFDPVSVFVREHILIEFQVDASQVVDCTLNGLE
jgi:hypothetical protein